MIVQTIGGTKRRIFVSFDFSRDRPFRDIFLNHGRKSDATWHVVHTSREFDPEDKMFVSTATGHIKESEAVVVLLGPTTFGCPGVLKEVAIGIMLSKPIYQIIPYGAGTPHTIPNAGRVVRWDWENVKRAIATAPSRWGSRAVHV